MFGGKIFLALLLAIIVIQVVGQFRWRLEELALFLFGVMMACLHVRFLLVFVPFFALVLASLLARWVPRYDARKDKFALNIAIMLAICIGIIHYFPSRAKLFEDVRKTFPVGAVEYMQAHSVPGPMFNNYGFGGYLVLSVAPERKLFIDGRGDVYERGGILGDYLHISRLRPGALTILDNYGVQSCLLQRDEPLATALSTSPAWQKIYGDDVSMMFVRRTVR